MFSLMMLLLVVAGSEGLLRLFRFDYQPRERLCPKPMVAMKLGAVVSHIPTVFDPPGYLWIMPPNILKDGPPGERVYEWPTNRAEGVRRVVFLGGSTTQENGWHDYPYRTIKLLNEACGSNAYEGINLGLSSYSTHQSLLALQRYGLPAYPDCVVVFHGWNDAAVQAGGYRDEEVERRMRYGGMPPQVEWMPGWVDGFRLKAFVAWVLDRLDVTWPRSRVSMQEFEEHLQSMADLCAERNIPLVIAKRPIDVRSPNGLDELTTRAYAPVFGTNGAAIYRGIHGQVVEVQKLVAEKNRNRGVRLADLDGRLDVLQQDFRDHPREFVGVFMDDHLHVYALANQAIAEEMARQIAPERVGQINATIQTARYWEGIAGDFVTMGEPFQCLYALDRAEEIDNESAVRMARVRNWAESEREFYRLFETGRWDNGMDVPFETRMQALSRCQELRPGEYGVIQQICRVCHYMANPEMALPYLAEFRPETIEDQYKRLDLVLTCQMDQGNWPGVRETALAILELRPDDPRARDIANVLPDNGCGPTQ
ncbi:MAG: SGNH/GDSL hydrolase family protein [Kiritimatiellae bacterium]|nr:SGNH/GDSL hydrolase family protein [Kiritimatiellia bacterium]